MTADERVDAMLEHLSRRPLLDVRAPDASRIRERCHTALRRRSLTGAPRQPVRPLTWRVLEPALVAAVCAVYLTEVVRRALALLGS